MVESAKCSGPQADLAGIWKNPLIEKCKITAKVIYNLRTESNINSISEASNMSYESMKNSIYNSIAESKQNQTNKQKDNNIIREETKIIKHVDTDIKTEYDPK